MNPRRFSCICSCLCGASLYGSELLCDWCAQDHPPHPVTRALDAIADRLRRLFGG